MPGKILTALVAICFAQAISTAPSDYKKGGKIGLAALARRAGLEYFGTAIDNVSIPDLFKNVTYMKIADNPNEFNQWTPANAQKWVYIEPNQDVFDFTQADAVNDRARRNGQLNRCHNLVWHSQLPNWLTSQTWDKKTLLSILETHIKNEVTHFKGKCLHWDVVNEAFNEDGTLRESIWLTTIGPEYIATAFKLAHKYDPSAKLYYNDYNIETINNKSRAAAELVKDLQRKKIKIDGVGLQSHFTVGGTPTYEQQVENMEQFTSLGIDVAITELDVRMTLPDSQANSSQQAKDYAHTVRACKDMRRTYKKGACVGITLWDFYDPFSWVPGYFEGQGNADIVYANFTKKPAYFAIAKILGT